MFCGHPRLCTRSFCVTEPDRLYALRRIPMGDLDSDGEFNVTVSGDVTFHE
jgi:hypothetical protein